MAVFLSHLFGADLYDFLGGECYTIYIFICNNSRKLKYVFKIKNK